MWISDALVPVTDTCLVPAVVNVQDSIALPEPVTLVGETLQEVLFVARLTTPAKPLRAATVMVEDPDAPTLMFRLVGAAEIAKS